MFTRPSGRWYFQELLRMKKGLLVPSVGVWVLIHLALPVLISNYTIKSEEHLQLVKNSE